MDQWGCGTTATTIHMGLPSPAYFDAHNRPIASLRPVFAALDHVGSQLPQSPCHKPTQVSHIDSTAQALAERLPLLDQGQNAKQFSPAAYAKYREMLARMVSDGANNANSHGALFLEGLQIAMANRVHNVQRNGSAPITSVIPQEPLCITEEFPSPGPSSQAQALSMAIPLMTPKMDTMTPKMDTTTPIQRSFSAPALASKPPERDVVARREPIMSARSAALRLRSSLSKARATDSRHAARSRMRLVDNSLGRANICGSRLASFNKNGEKLARPDLMSNVLGWTTTTRRHTREGNTTPNDFDTDDSDTDSVCSDPGCHCDAPRSLDPLTCRFGPDQELTHSSQVGCKSLLNLIRVRRRRLALKLGKTSLSSIQMPKSCIRDRTVSHRTKRVRISGDRCASAPAIQMPPSPESDDQRQPPVSLTDLVEPEIVVYQKENKAVNLPAAQSSHVRKTSIGRADGLLQRRARMPSSIMINVNEVVTAKTPFAHLSMPLERSRSWDTQLVWAPPMFGFENEPIHSPLDEDFPDTPSLSNSPFGPTVKSKDPSFAPRTPVRSTPLRQTHVRTPSDRISVGQSSSLHGQSFSIDSLVSDNGSLLSTGGPLTPDDRFGDKDSTRACAPMPPWMVSPSSPTFGMAPDDQHKQTKPSMLVLRL